MTVYLVETSVDTREKAQSLAQAVLNDRLAGCVQIGEVESLYHWKGAVETASEFVLRIKTTKSCVDELMEKIAAHHPYETPEIIAAPIERVFPAYREWLSKECQPR